MPLNSKNAEVFVREIAAHLKNKDQIKYNNEVWKDTFATFSKAMPDEKYRTEALKNQEHPLEIYLKRIRTQILDCESVMIDVLELGKVRIFPPKMTNILLDKYDIFGRGIDTARAVLEILRCASGDVLYITKLELALKAFQRVIDACQDNTKGLEIAEKELEKFNTAACSLLHQAKICSSKDKAKKSINFVRDFIWKKTWQQESFCTVIPNNPTNVNRGVLLRFAKPMEVSNGLELGKNKSRSIWHDAYIKHKTFGLQSKYKWAWYERLYKSLGPWFDIFSEIHLEELTKISSTPMSRAIPGPANAYDSTLISVDTTGHVKQVLSGTQLAITEPAEIDSDLERYRITLDSHVSIVFGKNGERLKNIIERQMVRWQPLQDKKEIDIPILHQTLIGDDVFIPFLIPDTKKSVTSLDNRETANEHLRNLFALVKIYYNPNNQHFIFHSVDNPKEREQKSDSDYYQINFKVLETNNCINNHHRYTRVRDCDFRDSRNLIKMAALKLEQLKTKLEDSKGQDAKQVANLHTIIRFLKSNNYSLIDPYKTYSKQVDNALNELTVYLRKESTALSAFLSVQTCNDIALLAQACTELKCTVHESIGGWARRWFNNTAGQLPLGMGATLRFTSWLISPPLRLLQVRAPYMYLKYNTTRRKPAHKAVNEQLAAELLGEKFGGCMSSEDRGEEIEQFKEANLRAFQDRGRILRYNDSPSEKRKFMDIYGTTTQEKHNFNKMSTGSSASSDTETRPWGWIFGERLGNFFGDSGIFSANETMAEQRLSKKMEHLRKGVYSSHDISIDEYHLGVEMRVSRAQLAMLSKTSVLKFQLKTVPSEEKNQDEIGRSKISGSYQIYFKKIAMQNNHREESPLKENEPASFLEFASEASYFDKTVEQDDLGRSFLLSSLGLSH